MKSVDGKIAKALIAEHDAIVNALADKRAERDTLALEIRELVADERQYALAVKHLRKALDH